MSRRKLRQRRQRRKVRALLSFGESAVPSHRSRGGRTGQVHFKTMDARLDGAQRATTKRSTTSEVVTRLAAQPVSVKRLGGFLNFEVTP